MTTAAVKKNGIPTRRRGTHVHLICNAPFAANLQSASAAAADCSRLRLQWSKRGKGLCQCQLLRNITWLKLAVNYVSQCRKLVSRSRIANVQTETSVHVSEFTPWSSTASHNRPLAGFGPLSEPLTKAEQQPYPNNAIHMYYKEQRFLPCIKRTPGIQFLLIIQNSCCLTCYRLG